MKQNTCVVYIITKLELGGAQKVCLTLLNNSAHDTYLVTGAHGPLVQQVRDHTNVFLLTSMQREVHLLGAWQEIKNFFTIIRILRSLKKKYAHVIVHTHSTKAGLLGRWAAFFARIPTRVHTIHGYGFNDFQPWYIWSVIYTLELVTSLITTHFVCVSADDARTGCRLLPFFTHKHTLIRAAVDSPAFIDQTKTSHSKTSPFIFGTVACFKPQKNFFDLLRAFALVHKKYTQARLEIIGDGILRAPIEQWLAREHLAHAVTLHGWQDRVAPIAAQWHAFVLTSLWEGLPCSVIEARLLNLPVISYKTGGIPEVITHGVNGLLDEQKDWRAIAQSMLRLIEDPALRTALSEYQDNFDEFHNEIMLQKHLALYQKLVSVRARSVI